MSISETVIVFQSWHPCAMVIVGGGCGEAHRSEGQHNNKYSVSCSETVIGLLLVFFILFKTHKTPVRCILRGDFSLLLEIRKRENDCG